MKRKDGLARECYPVEGSYANSSNSFGLIYKAPVSKFSILFVRPTIASRSSSFSSSSRVSSLTPHITFSPPLIFIWFTHPRRSTRLFVGNDDRCLYGTQAGVRVGEFLQLEHNHLVFT